MALFFLPWEQGGARRGEILNLKWQDVDFVRSALSFLFQKEVDQWFQIHNIDIRSRKPTLRFKVINHLKLRL